MSKSPSKTATDRNLRVEYYDWSRWLPMFTSVAFALAVALVIARGISSDFLREAFDAVPGGDAAPHAGLPDTAVSLDLLCFLPALLVLIRRALDRTYVLRFSIAHALFLALALLAWVSTFWSADRFAAGVGGFHFLAAAAVCWAGSQLVRSWQRLRVIGAMAAGILAVIALQGIFYRTVELADLQRMIEKDKARIMAERGWTADSFAWKQFSRKVANGEMLGFYTSPNTTAAMIVTLAAIVAALAAQRLRDRDEPVWPIALIVVVLASLYVLYFTGARAALVTPIIAIALIAIGWKFGARLSQRRRTVFAAACGFAAVCTSGVIGHGLYHGTLLHDSLTFRWKYWLGSAAVFKDHWLTGVGYGNFGYSYLAHRLPEASEEIKDPHNLFVRAFVELGVVGGLLMIGFLVRLAWEITRPILPPSPTAQPALATKPGLGLVLAIAILASLLNTFAAIDFARDPGYVATELLRRLLMLGLLLLTFAAASVRSAKSVHLDDRPAPLLLLGLIAAVAVFLVHNLIDFALFEPGPMLLFALLCGALIGVRGESLAGRKKWNRASVALTGAALTAWLVALIAFVLPLVDAETRAQRGDDLLRANNPRAATAAYKYAFDNAPLRNADYAYRAGRSLIIENRDPAETELWLSQAIAANLKDGNYRLTRASFQLSQPDNKQNRRQIIADLQSAVALDPNNIQSRLRLAETFDRFGDRSKASEQYRKTIELNDQLNSDEPKRLPAADLDRIKLLIIK